MGVQSCTLPAGALLQRYDRENAYTDCFTVVVPGPVMLGAFVAAFYTTRLFKSERAILALAGYPSTDAEAHALAQGQATSFAAWRVEDRSEDELLMCDTSGRTRSWFKAVPEPQGSSLHTRLYFGSAIVPTGGAKSKTPLIGPVFRALTGAHILYSRALLNAARRMIENGQKTDVA